MSKLKIIVSTSGATNPDGVEIVNVIQLFRAHGIDADVYWLVGVGTLETVVRAVLAELRR